MKPNKINSARRDDPLNIGLLDVVKNSSFTFLDALCIDGSLEIYQHSKRSIFVASKSLRRSFRFVALDSDKFDETLDEVKTLDIIILIHHPDHITDQHSHLLRVINIHCLPTLVHVMPDLNESNSSKSKRSTKIEGQKIHYLRVTADYTKLYHTLANTKLKRSHFKEARPIVLSDKVELIGGCLSVSGYVRAKVLDPNDILSVVGFGDYLVKKIDILAGIEGPLIETIKPDPMKQSSLDEENEIDPMEGEQTWPMEEDQEAGQDEAAEYKIEMEQEQKDNDDDSDDKDDDEDDGDTGDADDIYESAQEEADDDTDHVPARVRFARYRGLKSWRTSNWDPQESLPTDYSRIFQFKNFKHTRKMVMLDDSKQGAKPGQYVRVHLVDVPQELVSRLLARSLPPNLIALLKYEKKMTVMNLVIKSLHNPRIPQIKSKDELIFHVGFRKFKARPLFTVHGVSSKFKYEPLMNEEGAMVATMYAPVTFPTAPVLVFKEDPAEHRQLVATGSVLNSDPRRLIIKRIRLVGHPYKIRSKAAVLRNMFFNSEDVRYFKPVELVTKYNRRGHILEPLGTHGYMKCVFDKKLRSDDLVYMNLYKRVYPKWNYEALTEC